MNLNMKKIIYFCLHKQLGGITTPFLLPFAFLQNDVAAPDFL
jgi:hypothetical protein